MTNFLQDWPVFKTVCVHVRSTRLQRTPRAPYSLPPLSLGRTRVRLTQNSMLLYRLLKNEPLLTPPFTFRCTLQRNIATHPRKHVTTKVACALSSTLSLGEGRLSIRVVAHRTSLLQTPFHSSNLLRASTTRKSMFDDFLECHRFDFRRLICVEAKVAGEQRKSRREARVRTRLSTR